MIWFSPGVPSARKVINTFICSKMMLRGLWNKDPASCITEATLIEIGVYWLVKACNWIYLTFHGKEAQEKKNMQLRRQGNFLCKKENKLKRVSVLVSCTACAVDSCIAQVCLFYQLSLPLLKRLLFISIYIQATWVTFFNTVNCCL